MSAGAASRNTVIQNLIVSTAARMGQSAERRISGSVPTPRSVFTYARKNSTLIVSAPMSILASILLAEQLMTVLRIPKSRVRMSTSGRSTRIYTNVITTDRQITNAWIIRGTIFRKTATRKSASQFLAQRSLIKRNAASWA